MVTDVLTVVGLLFAAGGQVFATQDYVDAQIAPIERQTRFLVCHKVAERDRFDASGCYVLLKDRDLPDVANPQRR